MPRSNSPALEPIRITSSSEFEEALDVRYAVFCDEQGISREVERDEADAFATHVVIRDADGRAVATGRVVRQRSDGTFVPLNGVDAGPSDVARIGRMAVRREARRSGLGAAVISALEREACAAGLQEALLHAQVHAAPFYRSCGYLPQGEEFLEEEIPHIEMVKRLS